MTTTLLEEPLVCPSTSPSQRLRTTMAAVRVSLSWLGVRKTRRDSQSQEWGRSYFIPLFIIAIALVIWTGFQTTQLLGERKYLKVALNDQSPTVEQAQKLRAQLDSIAKGTLQLANQGNSSAKIIVEELRKRGVTINPGDSPKADSPKK